MGTEEEQILKNLKQGMSRHTILFHQLQTI